MDDQEKDRSIRFGFYRSDLLGDADPRRYDVEACAQRYADLCRDTLRQAYPDYEIEISFESDLRTQVDGLSDSPEVDVIEQIRDKVHQDFKWEVPRSWLDAADAHDRFGVPVSLIRWACCEGLIREAEKPKGYWEFPLEAFLEVRMIPAFANCTEILAIETTSDADRRVVASYSYDQLDACVDEMTAPMRLLVVLPEDVEHPKWFTRDNTLLLLSKNGEDLDLEAEHFVDVIQWRNTKWAYDAFARTMISQVSRRMSVTAFLDEVADYGGQRTDGTRFVFGRSVWQGRKLHGLINDALSLLEELARDSEIELAGGPCWRIEYERKGNESLFCQEVLGPLLRRMGFLDVRYTHGSGEQGKDFTFAEMTKWGELRYCALQAKAGNVKGGVNSEINGLLGQVSDAFENDYDILGDGSPKHISTFIIAISGSFTENAEKKIKNKVRRAIVGSVHFLDRERILGLISRYWASMK